jgi:hypothetical protein
MLAILLALASAAGYGGSDYAGGLAARRGSVIRITILAQAVSAALMIFILPLAGLPAPSPGGLAWGAIAGVGEAIGALALYAGFRTRRSALLGRSARSARRDSRYLPVSCWASVPARWR